MNFRIFHAIQRMTLHKQKYGILAMLMLLSGIIAGSATAQSDSILFFVSEPAPSSIVERTFDITGWAVDRDASDEDAPGINAITIHEGADCSGNILADALPTLPREDVLESQGLDEAFLESGFSTTITAPEEAEFLTFTVCVQGVDDNRVNSAPFTVIFDPNHLFVDTPANDEVVSQTVSVTGWAFSAEAGEGNGPGLSAIRVHRGDSCEGDILGEILPNAPRPDVSALFSLDETYDNNGFAVPLSGISSGDFTVTVCTYGTADPTTPLDSEIRQITLVTPIFSVDEPAPDSEVEAPLTISGWAFDTTTAADNASGISFVRIYRGESCEGDLIGEVETDQPRAEIQTTYGLGDQFLNSGFELEVEDWREGELTFTTCFYSPEFDNAIASETRTILVQEGENVLIIVAIVVLIIAVMTFVLVPYGFRMVERYIGISK